MMCHSLIPRILPTAVLLLAGGIVLIGCGGGGEVPRTESPGGSGPAVGPVWFEEAAERSGLVFHHDSGSTGRPLFPEIIGGGAALFDMDGDGDLDAYLVQSGSLREPDTARGANRLFRNDGQGDFEDVTVGSGAGDRGYGMGVAAGDYDNDGDVDLYVTNFGPNVLLRNDGRGRFTDVTEDAGVGNPSWSISAGFVDYDGDGDLDLFMANYVNWTERIEQDCYNHSGLVDYCLPNNYNAPATDTLYRNDGGGRFTDVTEPAGLLTAFGNGMGVVCGDYDDDGDQDLFVANDTMLNQLWINQGDGSFVDESLFRGCALDEHGREKAGMGVTTADIDDDGDLDLLVVNLKGQTDSFFRNDGGFFSDQTGVVGLGTTSRSYTRFGIGLYDFDNDGHLDLYEANGKVTKSPEAEGDPYTEPNVLFRGDGRGRFMTVSPLGGAERPVAYTSRAAAFGDVDGDGGVDVLVVNRDGPAQLLRNVVAHPGEWIGFRVLDEHGRDALGATVTFEIDGRKLRRDVRSAFGYCASSDPRLHVGLGSASGVQNVTVRWIGGSIERFGHRAAGQLVELRRGT